MRLRGGIVAAVVKKGEAFYVVVTVGSKQRWHRAGNCRRGAKALALKLEGEKLAGVLSEVDAHKMESERPRAQAVADSIKAYETYLRAAGRHPVHIATTMKYCRAMFHHAKVEMIESLTLGH